MSWPTFLESGKISVRILLPIALLTAALLFLPQAWKHALQIENLTSKYAEYIGPAFLISIILILIELTIYIFSSIQKSRNKSKVKGFIMEHLQNLTPSEKSVIREFYLCAQDTLPFPFNDATVVGLISKRILVQIGSHGNMLYGEICFNYCIGDNVKRLIEPIMIDLPINPTNEDINALGKVRPHWQS